MGRFAIPAICPSAAGSACAGGIIETPMRPDKLTEGLAEIRKGKRNEADDKSRNAVVSG